MAAVLSNGGGFYHAFAYVAEAIRMGLTILPPDVNASDFRCSGKGRELRIGLQYLKGLSADGVERVFAARGSPFTSLLDFRTRTGIAPSDLRLLIKVGALDSIAGGWTRPMMLWLVDSEGQRGGGADRQQEHTRKGQPEEADCPPAQRAPAPLPRWFEDLPPAVPTLREYSPERRRREEYETLGFITDAHPMQFHADRLRRFRLCPSIELHRHVGRHILAAGMLTTAKPVHTAKDEPMEFATFDDGYGLIEAVLFPQVYRERGHVLFDQGPFIFRGKVEEEFGAVTLTITHLERLERARIKSGR
jgi:error-prone DNA polymerase